MPLTVFVPVTDGRSRGETGRFVTVSGDRIVLGRGASADVRLPDASVATRHATVRADGGRWLLQDERSRNGTAVRGADGAVVRLDGQAVMITRNAGRFGDDLATRVILSRDLFRRLIEHLRTMRKPGPEVDVQNSEGTLVAEDLEADLPRLTHFYFGDLNGPTENEGPPGGAGGL